jgi:fructose-1,6-bisphosphatase/inositol monophosphatase family enzyme
MFGIRQTFRNSAIVLGLALLAAGTMLAVFRGPNEGVWDSIFGGLILLAMGGITEYLWMRLDKTSGR